MDWLERTAKLRQWSGSGTRALKPLLLLYALGRFQDDAQGELRYSAVESDLNSVPVSVGTTVAAA
jgi:putative restriction endonuclease